MRTNAIDLRSDTVTHPSEAMRRAMYEAELGDDGFGDDPTVNSLQEMAAEKLGKQAGLFVPSGTMGNLVCTLTHCRRGEEVIVGASSHMVKHERAGMSSVAGVFPKALENQVDGTLELPSIEAAINPVGHMFARTRLICLENTWNGRVLTPSYVRLVREIANANGLRTHLDGARLFNAVVASGVSVDKLCRDFDSVQFCFSKGLSAPVGSMICGTEEFIKEARNYRHMVGGTMRQVGVLAAPCIIALNDMVDRLAEDHDNAQHLAQGLAEIADIEIDPEQVETNIVFFKTSPRVVAFALANQLEKEGVLVVPYNSSEIRAVTHYGISREDIDRALATISRVLKSIKAPS